MKENGIVSLIQTHNNYQGVEAFNKITTFLFH